MKVFILILCTFPFCCYGDDTLNRSRLKESSVCDVLLGVWFTDITIRGQDYGLKRDIVRIERQLDGQIALAGVSIYFKSMEVTDWRFSGTWRCDGEWYVENTENGSAALKIVSLSKNRNVFIDQLNNFKSDQPETISESRKLKKVKLLKNIPKVAKILGL